jgi:hypothetical protein
MVVKGEDGHDSQASMDLQQISEFMAILSHCQHALVLAHAGQEIDLRTFDPRSAFQPVAGSHAIGAYEGMPKFAVGVEEAIGAVGALCLGSSGRLTGYRMSPGTAQTLGLALLDSAGKVPTTPPPKQ